MRRRSAGPAKCSRAASDDLSLRIGRDEAANSRTVRSRSVSTITVRLDGLQTRDCGFAASRPAGHLLRMDGSGYRQPFRDPFTPIQEGEGRVLELGPRGGADANLLHMGLQTGDAGTRCSWLHDILRRDGTPFSHLDVRILKHLTSSRRGRPAVGHGCRAHCAEAVRRCGVIRWKTPESNWFEPEFDDSKWKQGAAPFGRAEPESGCAILAPRGIRTASGCAARSTWPLGYDDSLVLSMYHDEEAEVYFNGVLAATAIGYNAAYDHFDLSSAGRPH